MTTSQPASNGPPPRRGGMFRRSSPAPTPASKPEKPEKPQRRPPKRLRGGGLSALSGVLSFMLIAAIIGLGAFAFAFYEATRPGPLEADKVVIIGREEDGGTIGDQLERAGVIDSANWFSAITLIDGARSALKRGEYEFKAGMSIRQVEALLSSGKVVQHKVAIPEGLTSDQVLQRVRDADFLVGEVREPPKEGSLLPETYDFTRGATRDSVIQRLQKEQVKAVAEIWTKRAPDLPIKSPGELVTLASLVEKETGKPEERAHVAGVFMNRLSKHMKLQSDPTIVYGLAFGKGTLGHAITRAELDQATPYNTYIIDGLPPGPICNPGRAALEAVANPMKTKDLYFVADGTGGHAFAETIEQHQANVARWRQIEQDAKDRVAPGVADPTPPAASPAPAAKPAPTPKPSASPKPHADAEPVDPRVFGGLGAPGKPQKAGPLDKSLAKLADRQRSLEALIGQNGTLAKTSTGGKSLADLGAVVGGVNDPDSEAAAAALAPAVTPGATAKDLFDSGDPLPTAVADATPRPTATGVHRIFDASEGTPLDPLRNKTWDLNYPHDVPTPKQ